MKNVGEMDLNYLCLGCGGCEVVCPVEAVKIELKDEVYQPVVDDEKCIDCGKCLRGCPGLEADRKRYSEQIFAAEKSCSQDHVLGRFISNYLAYSTDENLRYEAASGGLATSILIYLFKENIIEGAVVTRMSEHDQTKSETFVAQSIEELKNAKTSKYCSTHPLSALKELKEFKNDQKFAFVGLPCHIHGLRKIQEQEQWLKDKIILAVGLLCTHSVNYAGTNLILEKLGSGKKNLKRMQYRGKGWPGEAVIKYENNQRSIPLADYWNPYFGPYFFTPYRCLSCSDLTAELADISLGDAWLKEIEAQDDRGSSIVISRTDFSEKILKDMKADNLLYLENISKERIKESQANIIVRKKFSIDYRLNLFKFFSKPIPKSDSESKAAEDSILEKTAGYLGALLIWFNAYLGKKKFAYQVIKLLPAGILKKYSTLVNKLAGREF